MAGRTFASPSRRRTFWLGLVLAVLGAALVVTQIGVFDTDPSGFLVFWGGLLLLLGVFFLVVSLRAANRGDRFAITRVAFPVGASEQHRVIVSWDQIWGNVFITVDGVAVVDDIQTFTVRLVTRWEFTVGDRERHSVRIDKHRPLLAPAMRPQPLVAYVDGVNVALGDA